MTMRASQRGISPGCMDFREAVSRHYGAFLEEYGFVTAAERDWAGERCLLTVESSDCRLLFMYDRGSVEVYGGRGHGLADKGERSEDHQEWFAISIVLDFLAGRPKPTLEELLAQSEEWLAPSFEDDLARTAKAVREAAIDVLGLFRQDSSGEQWQAFEAYYSDNRDLNRELQDKFGRPPNKGRSR